MADEKRGDCRAASLEQAVPVLVRTMRACGEDIREDAEDLLMDLAEAIVHWNSMINLVSRKDIERLVSYHFSDSASLLPILHPNRPLNLLDVGGSNGLPGLVLASLSPHLAVTICDSQRKRQAFMDDIFSRLSLRGVRGRFEAARVDDSRFRSANAGTFDIITARAVTRLKLLLKWCLPLLNPGGRLVSYKGSRCGEEIKHAQTYFFRHGGSMLALAASPLADACNPLRLFVIAEYEPSPITTWECA
jgi:16S rRNA (guanine527-N7)-methyltransferase